MRSHRAFAISDGGSSSDAVFRLLLELAAPVSLRSVECVIVDTKELETAVPMQSFGMPGEGAFGHIGWQRQVLELGKCSKFNDRAMAVLENYRSLAFAYGLRLTGEHRLDVGIDAVIQRSVHCDLVFCGMSRGWDHTSPGLSSVVASLISRGRRPVVLSRPSFPGVKRIVVATRADDTMISLLKIGTAWSKCLGLPLTIIWGASTDRQLGRRFFAIRRAMSTLGITAAMIGWMRGLARLAEELLPSDLLLSSACNRPWPVELCFGSHTEALVRNAPCPMVIFPARFDQSDCDAVVVKPAVCNN